MLKLYKDEHKIAYKIPLTTTSGKIRIKKRSIIHEYGIPVATRSNVFSQKHYVEWQIGYDIVTTEIENEETTTLVNKQFVGANGKTKSLYELSEIIYLFTKWGIISKQKLEKVRDFIISANENLLVDVNPDFEITRSHPIHRDLFGIDFEKSNVSYPLLIHKFGAFEIITEIVIREKQRAIGVQPMLYLCFPIMELVSKKELIGRTAEPKETADFVFDEPKIDMLLEIFKIFGILSKNHKHDILQIIKVILVN